MMATTTNRTWIKTPRNLGSKSKTNIDPKDSNEPETRLENKEQSPKLYSKHDGDSVKVSMVVKEVLTVAMVMVRVFRNGWKRGFRDKTTVGGGYDRGLASFWHQRQ